MHLKGLETSWRTRGCAFVSLYGSKGASHTEAASLLLGNGRMAYFYEDDDDDEDMPAPESLEPHHKYDCLNTHLGKAGGLNFGLHAVAMLLFEAREPPPSPTFPLLFGIVDARHACDQRFWIHVMPPFFTADEHSAVSMEPDIGFVQVAQHPDPTRTQTRLCTPSRILSTTLRPSLTRHRLPCRWRTITSAWSTRTTSSTCATTFSSPAWPSSATR